MDKVTVPPNIKAYRRTKYSKGSPKDNGVRDREAWKSTGARPKETLNSMKPNIYGSCAKGNRDGTTDDRGRTPCSKGGNEGMKGRRDSEKHVQSQQPMRQNNHQRRERKFIIIQWLLGLRGETPYHISRSLRRRQDDLEHSLKCIRKGEPIEFYPWISALINILAKLSNASNDEFLGVIGCLQRASFFDSTLAPYLTILEADGGKNAAVVLAEVDSVITLLENMLNHMPSSTVSILGIDVIVKSVLRRADVAQLIESRAYNTLSCRVDDIGAGVRENIMRRSRRWGFSNECSSDEVLSEDPTDNFRDIDLYPSSEELLSKTKPFLRQNKVDGPYEDADQYLDIQYRLLREDFVRPLREGISGVIAHLQGTKRQKDIENVRIYRNVSICDSVFTNDGLGFRLYIPHTGFRNLEACKISKKLIFGSFLCMSRDNFETMVFATVANRNENDLMHGALDVSIVGTSIDELIPSDIRGGGYLMVESVAFFEAYKHVLKALKTFREIPFARYILQCEAEIDSPKYLRSKAMTRYDFTPIIYSEVVIEKQSTVTKQRPRCVQKRVTTSSQTQRPKIQARALDTDAWPTANKLGFDTFQYAAFMTALTKEFVVTQGPPGTGKTYIGLQIAKVLLNCQRNDSNKTPILVVCFTNHALDQFLEGITKFFKGNIVRAGGQSSNEALTEYSLNNVRQEMRTNGKIPNGIWSERKNAKGKMDNLKERINAVKICVSNVSSEDRHYIVSQYMTVEQTQSMLSGYFQVLFRLLRVDSKAQYINILHVWLELNNTARMYEDAVQPTINDGHTQDTAQYVNRHKEEDQTIEVRDQVKEITEERMTDDIDLEFVKNENTNTGGESVERWTPARVRQRSVQARLKSKLRTMEPMSEEEAMDISDVWTLTNNERWRLFRYWQGRHVYRLREKLREFEAAYLLAMTEYKRARMNEDKYIFGRSDVVGMTTTGAARYQEMLFEVGPKIVIVEEAAEVLETHIITTLSSKCEQLILIGDHEQLRPNPTTYELAIRYKLDVSLFERMIRNGVPSECLRLQYRMRPEISKLLRHIYPNLQDHESVKRYEHIKGVSKSFFFINHSEFESKNKEKDDEEKSHRNEHEGKYAVALCKYLIQQGYSRSQITVLTTYSAQLFYLRSLMISDYFEDVTIKVVDNYQGEENDIIILSLVRSNSQGNIGFLKIKNRICVALSRAKMGLYVLGNFDLLRSNSPLWDAMVKTMEEDDQIGNTLHLFCQKHSDFVINADQADDFAAAPEGGCHRPCEVRLECGHVCTRKCHSYDQDHKEFTCLKNCTRKCEQDHPCKKKCYEECKCNERVTKVLPSCAHSHVMPCFIDPKTFECHVQCSEDLECGHTFRYQCNIKHTRFECRETCQKVLPCGHVCREKCICSEKSVCLLKLTAELSCGHEIQYKCCEGTPPDKCQSNCETLLACGHKCQDLCGVPCTTECQKLVEKTFDCTHKANVKCYLYLTSKCQKRCDSFLSCGHKCQGTCTSCDEGRFHIPCRKCPNCTATLVCGHTCNGKVGSCGSCVRICENRCRHESCKHSCSLPCSIAGSQSPLSCTKPCEWRCRHFACSRKCNEPCDRPVCNQPCPRMKRCGHLCSGMCGEPCPLFCSRCDFEKDRDTFVHQDAISINDNVFTFGKAIDEHTKFILLSDCGHTIEVSIIDTWMQNWTRQPHSNDIQSFQLACCPVSNCRRRIYMHPRYNTVIREAERNLERIRKIRLEKMPTTSCNDQAKNILQRLTKDCEDFDRHGRQDIADCITALAGKLNDEGHMLYPQEIADFNDEFKRITLMMQVQALQEHSEENDLCATEMEAFLRRGRFKEAMQRKVNGTLRENNVMHLRRKYRFSEIASGLQPLTLHCDSWITLGKGHVSLANDAVDVKTCAYPTETRTTYISETKIITQEFHDSNVQDHLNKENIQTQPFSNGKNNGQHGRKHQQARAPAHSRARASPNMKLNSGLPQTQTRTRNKERAAYKTDTPMRDVQDKRDKRRSPSDGKIASGQSSTDISYNERTSFQNRTSTGKGPLKSYMKRTSSSGKLTFLRSSTDISHNERTSFQNRSSTGKGPLKSYMKSTPSSGKLTFLRSSTDIDIKGSATLQCGTPKENVKGTFDKKRLEKNGRHGKQSVSSGRNVSRPDPRTDDNSTRSQQDDGK